LPLALIWNWLQKQTVMKIKFILFITLLIAAQASMAQFNVGVKAGVNISKIDGRSFKDAFSYGYHLGGFAEIGLGSKFSLQPEVLFNQYQSKLDSNFKNIYQNAFADARSGNVKLNYLSVPLLLNYKLSKAFSLQAGPQFGVLINKDKNLLENGKEAFNNGDLSLLGGAQLRISKLRITGRYGIGLNNINDIDNKDKWKSQAFQLSLGIGL
jgi:hypothetical protein